MFKERYQMSLSQLLEAALAMKQDEEAIYDGYRRVTYQELDREAGQLASSLNQLGIGKGDRVAVSLPNWHEFIVIQFALAKLGAILIPFNTRFRKDEVMYILNNSGAKAVFFPEEFDHIHHAQQYREIEGSVPTLQHFITVRFEASDMLSYDRLLEDGKNKAILDAVIDPLHDVYAILYTSGTTGRPKGAMLTHRNLVHTAVAGTECMECTPNDVFLLPTPIFHVMGLMFVLRTIASVSRMVLMEKFKPEKALALIEQEKVTIQPGVPTMYILELNHPSFKKYDLSSLRTGEMGGAPAPVEIIKRIRSEMGCNVLVGYGMTEASPTLTLTSFKDDDELRAETVGRALPGVDLKIVDEQRKEVGIGVVGELACRSFGLMKGYYNMTEKTREVVDEQGWFYTGDLATMDMAGYIRIVGRKKEMIIRGGYNVYPREVEEHFYTLPYVNDVAIIGLPDTVLGEISCACIQLKPNCEATEEEVLTFIKSKVADYKVPDKIIFVDDFPMTPSGKIKKVDMQNKIKDQVQLR
ncbi:long-chain-fatty-acid-CoA ligase [Halalkalibacter wakoensis JCM 9140]|uniref:Long-chain-fatty-acid-CoA ligase n=1 Tax=Halalkalibacter wakoensis JCM 9140 TaxID=1236970 RepID=W4Q1U3_9BACI|nr:long-chain-fatty-acid--CoA ligase [Halalkalibacter wakoensis]GAE25349.1 long-chain-fatty-acid-CoA ligase [Halalkalibacter wakoensis JCM 9140]